MKKRNISVLVIAFILVGSLFVKCEKAENKCCDCLEKNGQSDAYLYPIVPGSEEWKKLSSHNAMVEVCQVPENTLKNMCTFGLIETYYNYPLMFVVTAFDNTKEGMAQMFEEFNAAHELLNRTDSPSRLLEEYVRLDPNDNDTTLSPVEQGAFHFKFSYMEFTLSYDPILNNLSKEQKSQLLVEALEKLNSKMKLFPSDWHLMTSMLLITNILDELNYEPFLVFKNDHPPIVGFIKGYMHHLMYLTNNDLNEIITIANNYLTGN
jgi:hypothetical protein